MIKIDVWRAAQSIIFLVPIILRDDVLVDVALILLSSLVLISVLIVRAGTLNIRNFKMYDGDALSNTDEQILAYLSVTQLFFASYSSL